MKYYKEITLKDGRKCVLRNADGKDVNEVLATFNKTHAETDFLLSYPDEKTFTVEEETEFLENAANSANEIEIIAIVDGKVAGSAGFYPVGKREKIRHRADFGISVEMVYWGLGIGRALTESCIELARQAGFVQLELEVVGENSRAIALYESCGFREYGRNPKGFKSRISGYQDLVQMRLEL